ncbi:methyltransferase [Streptomyces montanisoli]|uniref:O-methyltransferase n=1 Tax=Streptomyces montanisoli TaxID=2798581 RepID=A0A940MBF9_9ACTN|nr:methyltransferase [Streptomyces montanisoli]MBP0456582.1 O-methyltransferase [Streptomyces montanisoli]
MTGPFPYGVEQLPPHVRLMTIVAAKWMAQPIVVLAELDVAGALADGPLDTGELAARVDADADRLGRVLRAAECLGVVAREPGAGGWRMTEMGAVLRADVAHSLRDFTLFLGDPATMASFAELTGTVRGGAPGFDRAHGRPLFEHLAHAPELARRYQGAWGPLTEELAEEAASDFDFGRFGVLADIGGGRGELLAGLLPTLPHSRGILVDRPDVLESAARRFADGPLAGRVDFAPLGSVPAEADAYLFKNVLHCFPDETCAELLADVAAAMKGRPHTRLVLVEAIVADDDRFDWAKFIDIEVMADNGGRERTEAEWVALLGAAGYDVVSITPTTPPQSIIEAELA